LPAAVAVATLVLFLSLLRAIGHTRIARRRGRVGVVPVSTAKSVRDTEAILRKPDWRQLGNVGYLIFDIAALWACLRAVGKPRRCSRASSPIGSGYLANILPIPGSVGVLEGACRRPAPVWATPRRDRNRGHPLPRDRPLDCRARGHDRVRPAAPRVRSP
jgi:hypothetical protein